MLSWLEDLLLFQQIHNRITAYLEIIELRPHWALVILTLSPTNDVSAIPLKLGLQH